VFAARRRDVIRRNAALMPAYSLVLGLIALFGYMARATPAVNAGVQAGGGNSQLSVPLLFEHMFPSWFAGIGYSAIVIGALVPAAIMSIAAANLFTRNIYNEFFRPAATPAEETKQLIEGAGGVAAISTDSVAEWSSAQTERATARASGSRGQSWKVEKDSARYSQIARLSQITSSPCRSAGTVPDGEYFMIVALLVGS